GLRGAAVRRSRRAAPRQGHLRVRSHLGREGKAAPRLERGRERAGVPGALTCRAAAGPLDSHRTLHYKVKAMRSLRVKFILPALIEATGPRRRPIKYSLFPPLGLATLAAYLGPAD